MGKRLPGRPDQGAGGRGAAGAGRHEPGRPVAGMNVVPGVGVDFARLGQALLVVVAVYVLASVFAWGQAYLMAGVTQRVIYRLREDVDHKLGRLPLRYLDAPRPRRPAEPGDQRHRQHQHQPPAGLTQSDHLACPRCIGVLVDDGRGSAPLLAVISLVHGAAVPGRNRAHRQACAAALRPSSGGWTGRLNGHVEEMYSGHDIVKVYGRQAQAEAVRRGERASCTGRASAPSSSRDRPCRR